MYIIKCQNKKDLSYSALFSRRS